MSRVFKKADYDQTLEVTVRLGDCVPAEHLARFVVDCVGRLDLSGLYARYGSRGGAAYAPEILLGLLFYGYATGVFSSRKIERATYESLPFRFVAGNLHPDHDTLANFRRSYLEEIKDLFVQVLLLAEIAEVLKLGNISLDGTKIHADASKHHAVSYKRLLELEVQLRGEVEELFRLSERPEEIPDGMVVCEEIKRREGRLTQLDEAKRVLEARAQARMAIEQAEYDAKMAERAAREQETGKRTPGRSPMPPIPGPRDLDQYNFTDPESRIMKNPNNAGFEQAYNVQVAVDQTSFLIVGYSLSNHPNDSHEAEPTLAAIPTACGTPPAAALDTGYFGPATLDACAKRGIDPYIATGRDDHHSSWKQRFASESDPPPENASPKVKMAYKLKTNIGQAIYRLRKCTVEPVIGIMKEAIGFRQFSLRGELAAAGEWGLVCLAFNLKRFHTLSQAQTLP
jgi:transposase